MLEVAGNAAFLVDPEDVDSIREAIIRLMSDGRLRESLVSAGYENARRFQAASVAAQYESIYYQRCREAALPNSMAST